MKSTKNPRRITILCGLIVLLLCACSSHDSEKDAYSTTQELIGSISGTTFDVKDPSGETVVSLPLDLACADFPAMDRPRDPDEEATELPVFYGYDQSGLQWAFVCSGPSLGHMNTNVLLSTDQGESWTLASGCQNTPHDVVTGAGFQNDRIGFLCCRYTSDHGPVIYLTEDGGSSWERLEIPCPLSYQEFKKTAYSPVITEQGVSFPIDLRDEKDEITSVTCSSKDLKNWDWS